MGSVHDTPHFTEAKPDRMVLQQKRELAILNAIFEVISSTNDLKETLEKALDFILSFIDSAVGWVCLLEQEGACSAFVGYKGLCFSNGDGGPTPCLAHCVCDRVRKTKDVVVVTRLNPGCPLRSLDESGIEQVAGHVSVPLTAKGRIVGQLNVAFSEADQVDKHDIELLRTIGPQLAVAIENARLWGELQHKEKMRAELLRKVVSAQEEERRRISRELHDEMGQSLSSLLIGLKFLWNAKKDEQSSGVIENLCRTVSEMLESIHDLALELRPTALDDLGLEAALAQYFKECPARLGVKVDFEAISMNGRRLPRELETTFYRIAQESLTNVARHAKAENASVVLRASETSIVLIVEDDGTGFDPWAARQGQEHPRRLGLYGMEERAALVGATLTVESAPGQGTTIYVEAPLDAEVGRG
jgi:signal transduction histidine kinase